MYKRQTGVDLSKLEYFVIDEVDKMFTKGFKTDIDTIMKNIDKNVCKAFFSATVEDDLKNICDEMCIRDSFLDMYGLDAQDLIDLNINWVDLYNILQDYKKSIDICDAR